MLSREIKTKEEYETSLDRIKHLMDSDYGILIDCVLRYEDKRRPDET